MKLTPGIRLVVMALLGRPVMPPGTSRSWMNRPGAACGRRRTRPPRRRNSRRRGPYPRAGAASLRPTRKPQTLRTTRSRGAGISQCFEQYGERRSGLSTTRIVQMVTGEWRRPIRQKVDEFPFVDMRLNKIKGQVTDPASIERRNEHRGNAVDNKLSVDPDAKFASSLLEFPRVNPATCRQAQVDARVFGQVLRFSWQRFSG